MDAIEVLFARRSTGRLAAPAPSEDDLSLIMRAACAAPDHEELRPWRFTVLEGDAKDRFGAVLADAYIARCAAEGIDPVPAKTEKERTKLGRAPMVIVAGAAVVDGKVPPVEQLMAVGAACQNALLAATALGYGSMWRTGDPAYDVRVKAAVGLGPDDAIVGFLYLGSFREDSDGPPKPNEPDTDGFVTRWEG